GAGKLNNAFAVTGTAATNAVIVNMAAGGSIDLSAWTFTNWTGGTDTLAVNGSGGNDTFTGSTATDAFLGRLGNDTVIVTATRPSELGRYVRWRRGYRHTADRHGRRRHEHRSQRRGIR